MWVYTDTSEEYEADKWAVMTCPSCPHIHLGVASDGATRLMVTIDESEVDQLIADLINVRNTLRLKATIRTTHGGVRTTQ
jgi:hypothetical protein